MKKCLIIIFVFGLSTGIQYAQENTTIELIENHNSWGWDAYVMQNGIITLATVPVIGARVMQYDLGMHSSIFVNPNETGNSYEPNPGFWPNFGGYKVWPAPEANWNWPPPPILDYGEYSAQIVTDTPDSVALFVDSQTEQWKTPDVRLERKATLYRNSSRVKVDQTIINEGTSVVQWSVWDVTQSIVKHTGELDFENFWVYFPINPESKFGSDGVWYQSASNAWKGEVAPGIYGVQYLPHNTKIYADSHVGWICYVDERDSMAYAKTFEIWTGVEYPDNGAHVEVWVQGNPNYLEVEVVSPIVDLPANGGSYMFTEEWWAAKVHGPILGVNRVGAIGNKLALNTSTNELSGEYGIFHVGTAQVVFLDNDGTVLGEGQSVDVTPLQMFRLYESVTIPEGTQKVELHVKDGENQLIGTVDSADMDQLTNVRITDRVFPASFSLYQNFPNPFNNATQIQFNLDQDQELSLQVFDMQGKEVVTLTKGFFPAGSHTLVWNGQDHTGYSVASGIYFYRIQSEKFSTMKKMIYLK